MNKVKGFTLAEQHPARLETGGISGCWIARSKRTQRGFVLPSPTLMMGGAIAFLAVLVILFYNLYRGAVDDLATYRAQVEAAQAQLRADAERAKAESERITADVSNAWAKSLDYFRSNPRIVRVQSCAYTGGLRPLSAVTGELAKPYLEEHRFGSGRDVAVEECEARLNEAVKDAAWIEHVKAWADDQARIAR